MEKQKFALRILPASPELMEIVRQADGSIVCLPKMSTRDLAVVLQVMPIAEAADGTVTLGKAIETRRVSIRTGRAERRRVWISAGRDGR